jgi:redox-sensitive bicupin YhaK (pirin superfamily)
MLQIRHSAARGVTALGWLDSRHTFSFGHYYDPHYMGVSALRVLNDDSVQPGAGFAAHGHQDMEILTYVTEGVIAHQDSMGHTTRLPAGEFQLMSAGTGIRHSEYNASDTEPLHFLQIWIVPNQRGLAPGYQQKRFLVTAPMQLIASPDGRDGSLRVHQDASVYQVVLKAAQHLTWPVAPGRSVYLHLVCGTLTVNGATLQTGDGVTVTREDSVDLHGPTAAEALLVDLP